MTDHVVLVEDFLASGITMGDIAKIAKEYADEHPGWSVVVDGDSRQIRAVKDTEARP